MIFMVNGIILFHQICEHYLLTIPNLPHNWYGSKTDYSGQSPEYSARPTRPTQKEKSAR